MSTQWQGLSLKIDESRFSESDWQVATGRLMFLLWREGLTAKGSDIVTYLSCVAELANLQPGSAATFADLVEEQFKAHGMTTAK